MSDRPAEVFVIEEPSGDAMHGVSILDPVAQSLADLFLPPDGTRISGDDLRIAVEALVAATNAIKRLERES